MAGLTTPAYPVVIDPGSFRWRVGLANMPKFRTSFITDLSMLDNTAVENNGLIERFDSTEVSLIYFERYIRHGLQMLRCDHHGAHICLALPLGYSVAYRSQLAQVVLEGIGAKSIFMVSQPLLAAFASTQPTCTVIDSGYSYTSIYSMSDVYPERETEVILPIGGRDIDRYLTHLAPNLRNVSQTDINYMKSHYCEVSHELPQSSGVKQICEMADGKSLKLGFELKMGPELLFNPSMAGHASTPSIDTAVLESVSKLPRDKASNLLRNIIVSGGNMKFKGLCERLERAIMLLGRSTAKSLSSVHVSRHPNAETSVWTGGAVFSSMHTYPSMYITREGWKEHGEYIIQKRWL